MPDLSHLPNKLPSPKDDGACKHLVGLELPDISLETTSGPFISLADLAKTRSVLYLYPMTGRPDRDLPKDWDMIPGARGCTPQSCAFRDHHIELKSLGVQVYGLSTQPSFYQREAKERLHLPFELLSDNKLELCQALTLPTMTIADLSELSPDLPITLIKRLTLIVSDGKIEKVFYPVFPPDQNAQEVLAYLALAS